MVRGTPRLIARSHGGESSDFPWRWDLARAQGDSRERVTVHIDEFYAVAGCWGRLSMSEYDFLLRGELSALAGRESLSKARPVDESLKYTREAAFAASIGCWLASVLSRGATCLACMQRCLNCSSCDQVLVRKVRFNMKQISGMELGIAWQKGDRSRAGATNCSRGNKLTEK